jgi:hypothetical protein
MIYVCYFSNLILFLYVQWKTPWIELAIDEMPRFQQDFSIKLVPTLPKKNENDAENVWNPEKDVKMYVYFLSFILSFKKSNYCILY